MKVVRSGTKIRAGTNAGTTFPISLNQMSGVPAFTPIFHAVVSPGGICSSLVITVCDVTKMAAVTHSVTRFPLVLNDISSVTAFIPFFRGVVITVMVISVICMAAVLVFDLAKC